MRSSDNRIGFVSSFNPGTGMATVFYPDRNGEVTTELPVFSPFGIMQELKKGEAVLVLHLSNGGTAGIVLGSYSVNGGSAGITVVNGNMILRDANGAVSLKDIIEKCG
ncbi:MAG: hypothetical protein HFG70_07565 [Hungatella sp.]|nr:hypothetical protein [Hungatella sp.]